MTQYSPRNIQERTFKFSVRIIKLVDRLPRRLAAIELGRQVLRSGTSIGANVQEADAAESKKDFKHKMGIARKEAQETRYWLGLIVAEIIPNDKETIAMRQEADELARILRAIIDNTRDD
ncbi:MAG: four helix bundle protein [Chloroflexi bacterium]|nr:four helix bundle protein [Chloroflexota bacterium]